MSALLPCQLDARNVEIRTQVVECRPAPEGGFWVVLEESPFYPEGGGQPADCGWIGALPVLGLRKVGTGQVEHRLEAEVSGGVEARVDWRRRFDFMQQHTAQHLITALAADRFGWPTTAFHLSAEGADIELACEPPDERQLAELEELVNQKVRQALSVTIRVHRADELAGLPVRTRGLPEGFGPDTPVRLVEIEGVDLNTCGGTHVANTAELQSVKLLGTERLSRATRLPYVAGGRVTALLQESLAREWALTRLLSCGSVGHVQAVERMQAEAKQLDKERRLLQTELASLLGQSLAEGAQPAFLYRPDAGMEYLRQVANVARAANPNLVALLAAGSGPGVFLLVGPDQKLKQVGPRIAQALGGRGGGSGGLFQGKADKLDNLEEALALLRESSAA